MMECLLPLKEGRNNIQRLSAAESATLARGVENGTATIMVLVAEGSFS